MVAVVVPVKVGTQRRLLEVEEAVDLEQTAVACSSAEEIKLRAEEMQEQSFELDKHAQKLIQNQTWNFSRYPS